MTKNITELIDFSKTLNVLYVEDNKEARESTLVMLQNFFENITVAENGYEGLEKFKQNKKLKNENQFSIIISDINMPKMNGIEMIKAIREIDNFIDIIIISAHSEKKYLNEAINLSLIGYLYKPIQLNEFITISTLAIESVIKKSQHKKEIDTITKQNIDSEYLLNLYGDNVIASMTDTRGIITFASNAYEDISGYKREELIGKPHNLVRHPDMPKAAFKDLWDTIQIGKAWEGEVINLKKDGGYYWVKATITPQKDENGTILGYASIREDITMKKEIETLHSQVTNMLDNIDEGFLTFKKDLKINQSYSKKCLDILSQDEISGKNISEVLFSNNKSVKEIFDYAYSELLNTDDELSKDLFISLLPLEHTNNNKIFSIKYKLLENDECLVLIADVTKQKELEEEILHEQQMQKMIIAIATHQNEAIQLGESYNKFLDNIKAYVNDDSNEERGSAKLKRDLHTFKGLFAQHEMLYTTKAIHKVETIIEDPQYSNKKLINSLKQKLVRAFSNDLKVIADILGDDFLSSNSYISVEKNHLKSVTDKTKDIIKSNKYDKDDLLVLLEEINRMNDVPLFDMLNIYSITVANISTSIYKEMYPLEIIGDTKLLVSDSFKNFTDSLIHVFRNAMVHGIELNEERVTLGKDSKGKISCNFELIDDNVVLQISDDGKGIDTSKIIEKAIKQELITQEQVPQLSDQELLQLIFTTGFTTSEDLNHLAGRGVGLESVKYELQELNGEVKIENTTGLGLKFIFTIPYNQVKEMEQESSDDATLLVNNISSITESFLQNDLGIELIKSESCKNINFNKYYSIVKFSGDSEIFCIITISDELINSIFNAFVSCEVSDEERQEMIPTLPDEIVNTVAGLAITKFPKKYENLVMSEPIMLDINILQLLIEDNLSKTQEIETSDGNLTCTVIIIKD